MTITLLPAVRIPPRPTVEEVDGEGPTAPATGDRRLRAAVDPDDDDLGDEEDLAVSQPLSDEESNFDDFDDEFDDDFEEDEDDPDWDHPDDVDADEPPPAKGGGRG
jgi:hypothetical protein